MTTQNPSFLIYSASMVVLCLNILVLWAYSGAVRARTKVTPNREDVGAGRSSTLADADPPEVARVLRAHRNAADNILPFAVLGLLFVVWVGSPLLTAILCGTFVVARVAHSVSYLAEKQPWRTIMFAVAGLDTLVMVGFLAKALIASA
ncbi:MAG: MAPEG family protein [Deltaproteobacteria bacterium]|nr:MAPEG family protein [Deltaproteobacteria bacterium]